MKFLRQIAYIALDSKTIKLNQNQHGDFHRFHFSEDSVKTKMDLKLVSRPYFLYNFFDKNIQDCVYLQRFLVKSSYSFMLKHLMASRNLRS